MAITVTFIRHGESEDNPKGIWAGWKDAPLSELGRRQAAAIGKHLSTTKIDVVYASPLLRAHHTGLAVQEGLQEGPRKAEVPFNSHPKLREQYFGVAEGHRWVLHPPEGRSLEECFSEGIFPVLYERHQKFPEGESLDDLAKRAEEAISEIILPYLVENDGFHIAIASHGLCISELIAALLRLDPNSRRDVSYAGLLNTAWTRAVVSLDDGATAIDPKNLPPLKIRITDVNNAEHLVNVAPTSTPGHLDQSNDAEEAQQAEARAFFGGGGAAAEVVPKGNL